MRTSRISQETAKAIDSLASTTPRRTTRSSLSRLKHNATSPRVKSEEISDVTVAFDIEDAISPSRKRKRASQINGTVTIKSESKPTLSISPTKALPRVRKPARQVKDPATGEVVIHAPSDWEELYATVKEMRLHGAAANAAVDTMGCESLPAADVNPRDKRYHTLTALMLSSQTKDTTNAAAMKRLQTELPAHEAGAPPGLNLENILAVQPEVLNELIWSVGFHNNKTRYIKAAAEILRDRWAGDIPDTADGLMSLPGVGPKMAYLCLSAAWGRDEGIGVDVHVHRITNLWGWHATREPEQTRLALQAWLPRERWHEINWLLVGLGQTVCAPVGRRCGECAAGLAGLCRSADRGKVIAGRRAREERLKIEGGEVVEREEVVKVKEEVVGEVVMNAPEDEGAGVEGGEEEIPIEEGLSKEEERKAMDDIANAPGELVKTPTKRRKR